MKKYALMLLTLAVASCAAEKEEQTAEIAKAVKSVKLGEGNNGSSLSFPGKVIAGKEADITFKVSGKLNKLPVKEGQKIKKGDIIAQLDQRDFNFAYAKELASYKENKASFQRASELIKNRYISQSDFDKKKKSYDVAKANLDIAKTNLDYTILKAPFDGEVAKVYADNFQNIQVKENIAKIQNLDFLEVKINVPERAAIQKKSVQTMDVTVTFDANRTSSYKADITEISTQADPVTQTYEATVRMPRPVDMNVLPGMTAVVKIDVTLKNQTISLFKIPADSIFTDTDKKTYVWKVNSETRLEKAAIETEAFEKNLVIIKKGLKSGDQVVTAGVNFLREGQLVKDYKK